MDKTNLLAGVFQEKSQIFYAWSAPNAEARSLDQAIFLDTVEPPFELKKNRNLGVFFLSLHTLL